MLVTLAIVLAATGCAGKQTPAATTPSPTASPGAARSGPLNGLGGFRDYLERVKPITSELAATLASLPDAVKDLSAKPDDTWTTSAAKFDRIAARLDSEASSLAALTPPDGLQPVQAAAVKGIQEAQSAVTRIAGALDKHAATSAKERATLQSEIDKLQSQLSALSKMLGPGIEGLLGSTGSTSTT
jgi:hypothetical protein